MVYQPLLIARCSTAGGSYNSSLTYDAAFDTKERYGLWLQHSPYIGRAKAKNIISQEWKDQDGEDTIIPTTIFHEAEEIEFTFVYLRENYDFNQCIQSFITEIEGRWLKIYDSYTHQGRKGLYMTECGDIEYKRRDTHVYATVKVKFKVNDPTIYSQI